MASGCPQNRETAPEGGQGLRHPLWRTSGALRRLRDSIRGPVPTRNIIRGIRGAETIVTDVCFGFTIRFLRAMTVSRPPDVALPQALALRQSLRDSYPVKLARDAISFGSVSSLPSRSYP